MDPETKNDPRTTDVPITGRKLALRLPAEWLDRLLVALCEIEPGEPLEEALGAVLDAAAAALPHVSFGVRLPDPRAASDSGLLVLRRTPSLVAADPPPSGPLFPELALESQHPIDRVSAGVLSIAANDPAALPESAAVAALASRLSLTIGAALRTAQQIPRASASVPPPGDRMHAVHKDKLAGLGRVVAGVVHELNNPVTSILAYSEYLRRKAERGPLEPADIDRLARIEEAAQRIHGFSRELIAYARPSTEVPVPLVIHDVIDRALLFCEHVLGRARITVERELGEVRPVRGIGGQLAQVFVNLFTNAANAMSETGGTLCIRTGYDERTGLVHITVIDTGAGIAEHVFPHIFEPFVTTCETGGGTGLGLSIVRDIVEAHRGRVWAERRAGAGAAFHVTLPAAADD